MKKLELVLSALCLVLSAGVAQAATIDITLSNIVQNRTLQRGYIYRFTEGAKLTFEAVEKPSETAGFFSIGASPSSTFMP